jgi:hypothetical protein
MFPLGCTSPEPAAPRGGASLLASPSTGGAVTMNSFLGGVDWSRDWWKYIAGAIAYRLLVAK